MIVSRKHTLISPFGQLYVHVKVPLQVMYRKYSTRGGFKWQIQHEMKPTVVFARDSTRSTVFFHTSQVNGVLMICIGKISSSSSNGFGQMYISK